MKNNNYRNILIVFCLFACLPFFFACAPTTGNVEKSTSVPDLERYEDEVVGFSIEYDAERLTQDLGPVGPFVFRRQSAEGMPSMGITVGPYPPGTALEDTAELISSSLPMMIPGCLIDNVNNQRLINLTDGTEANYFEIELTIQETGHIAAFVVTQKNSSLIVFGILDKQDGTMENLTTMVKSLRLDVEVDEVLLRARGFAKNGRFVRTDSPAFTLEYPKEFQNRVLEPNQIFRAGIPQGSPAMSISISLMVAGENIDQQLQGLAEEYSKSLTSVGSDIKIISQNPINDYGEFNAYQIQIVWRYQGQTTLKTVVHLIAKEEKAILLAGHTIYTTDELTDIFKTIDLNP